MKSDNRNRWSKREMGILAECIIEAGIAQKGCELAAARIGRTKRACEQRWYKSTSKQRNDLLQSVRTSNVPKAVIQNPVTQKMQVVVTVKEDTITIQKVSNGVETLVVV